MNQGGSEMLPFEKAYVEGTIGELTLKLFRYHPENIEAAKLQMEILTERMDRLGCRPAQQTDHD